MSDEKQEGATRGPWEILDTDRGPLIIGAGSEHIATANNYYRVAERNAANARLISAAPDMLEALKEAYGAVNDAFGQANAEYQRLDGLAEKYDTKIQAFRAKARAAITKATEGGK